MFSHKTAEIAAKSCLSGPHKDDLELLLDGRSAASFGSQGQVRTCTLSLKLAERELFFDEELLEDIAKKLMRSYDVRIEIADSLKNRRFYGSFKVMGNTIEEVLETIASTNRMKYRYENEKYILY